LLRKTSVEGNETTEHTGRTSAVADLQYAVGVAAQYDIERSIGIIGICPSKETIRAKPRAHAKLGTSDSVEHYIE
jgi:hypothetical protein